MDWSRRDFLKKAGQAAAMGMAFSSPLVLGCVGPKVRKKSLEEILIPDHYAKLTEDWDPVYGPPLQWFSRYKGRGDFQGHIRGDAVPGVDYDVPMHTPLVPMTASCLRQRTRDENGALYILLIDIFNPSHRIFFAHLEETLLEERFLVAGDVMRYLGAGVRVLERGEIVALSGNSGFGPREYGYVQPPHLHLSLYYLNSKSNTMAYLDPEKHGIDGGKPVFWDGKTLLDVEVEKRVALLEFTLGNLSEELRSWSETPELDQLKGTLMEHHKLSGSPKGKKILDSKQFQDMRALMKRVVLEGKRYPPGTGPYTLMLKILGYSTDEKQKVILTLPFIAPGLAKIYKKPVFEEGAFYHLVPSRK
jgi:hypothetical protein